MVKVQLRRVHVVRTKLADGRRAEYHYAWKGKGAPRLTGEPGSPEYVASYHAAHAKRKQPTTGTMLELIAAFKASPEFEKLSGHTDRAYRRYLDQIQAEFGDLPLEALEDPEVRKDFIRWRNTMRDRPRTADYAVGTLKRLLKWGVEEVRIKSNQAEPIGRLHSVDRSESIWEESDLKAFKAQASPELAWAVELAMYTGLRQGDLVRLPWSAFDGESFLYRTSKRNKTVVIPATKACVALMTRIEKRGPVILTTQRGKRPWTTDGLRSSFAKACDDAKVDRTFHDLRRTAATNLLRAGLEASPVAMIMGWEEEAVEALKRKYVSRSAVAKAALAKLHRSR